MAGATCPVCGYGSPIWIDDAPTGCLAGGEQRLCRQSADRMRAEAMRRRLVPEAFVDGVIRKDTAPDGSPWLFFVQKRLASLGVDGNSGLLADETRPPPPEDDDMDGEPE